MDRRHQDAPWQNRNNTASARALGRRKTLYQAKPVIVTRTLLDQLSEKGECHFGEAHYSGCSGLRVTPRPSSR
jgi:hypothetical protein